MLPFMLELSLFFFKFLSVRKDFVHDKYCQWENGGFSSRSGMNLRLPLVANRQKRSRPLPPHSK